MRLYNLAKIYFVLFPILSGTVLFEYRLLGMSLITAGTFLLVTISFFVYVMHSRLRIGYTELYIAGLCLALLLFGTTEILSFLWMVTLIGGYTLGKNISKHISVAQKIKFLKLIKPMVFLTSLVCVAQLLLQERFLAPDLERALHQDIFKAPWGYRLSAFSSSPNSLAYFFVFTSWTAYMYRGILFKKEYLYHLFMCLQIAFLFLTLSRGAFLTLLVTILFFGRGRRIVRAFLFLLLCTLFVTAYSLTEEALWMRLMSEPRLYGFLNVMDYLFAHPETLVLGLGYSDAVLREIGFSDNFLLQILTAAGIPGLAMLILSIPSIPKYWTSPDRRYLLGLKVILFVSMFLAASPQLTYFFFPTISFFFVVFYSSRNKSAS